MSQASVEVARGDDVTLTCNFKPKNQVNSNTLIIITWSGHSDETSEDKVNHFFCNDSIDKLQLSTKIPLTMVSVKTMIGSFFGPIGNFWYLLLQSSRSRHWTTVCRQSHSRV